MNQCKYCKKDITGPDDYLERHRACWNERERRYSARLCVGCDGVMGSDDFAEEGIWHVGCVGKYSGYPNQ